MSFMWQFIGVMFGLAGAILALTISTIVLYIVAVAIQSAIEEKKKKNKKKGAENK